MYFKVLVCVMIGCVAVSAATIHRIDINDGVDDSLVMALRARFSGSVVNDGQIKHYIKQLNGKGVYKKIDYSLIRSDGKMILQFDIVQTPRIRSILFSSLPPPAIIIRKSRRLPLNFLPISKIS